MSDTPIVYLGMDLTADYFDIAVYRYISIEKILIDNKYKFIDNSDRINFKENEYKMIIYNTSENIESLLKQILLLNSLGCAVNSFINGSNLASLCHNILERIDYVRKTK